MAPALVNDKKNRFKALIASLFTRGGKGWLQDGEAGGRVTVRTLPLDFKRRLQGLYNASKQQGRKKWIDEAIAQKFKDHQLPDGYEPTIDLYIELLFPHMMKALKAPKARKATRSSPSFSSARGSPRSSRDGGAGADTPSPLTPAQVAAQRRIDGVGPGAFSGRKFSSAITASQRAGQRTRRVALASDSATTDAEAAEIETSVNDMLIDALKTAKIKLAENQEHEGRLQSALQDLQGELQRSNTTLVELEGRVREAETKVSTSEISLATKTEQFEALRKSKEDLDASEAAARSELTELKASVAGAKQKTEESAITLVQKNEELETLGKANKALEASLKESNADVVAARAELQEYKQSLAQKQNELQDSMAATERLTSNVSEKQTQMEKLNAELEQVNARLQDAEKQLQTKVDMIGASEIKRATLMEQLTASEETVATLRKAGDQRAAALGVKVGELERKVQDATDNVTKAEAALAESIEAGEASGTRIDELEGELESVKSKKTALDNSLAATNAKAGRLDAELERQLQVHEDQVSAFKALLGQREGELRQIREYSKAREAMWQRKINAIEAIAKHLEGPIFIRNEILNTILFGSAGGDDVQRIHQAYLAVNEYNKVTDPELLGDLLKRYNRRTQVISDDEGDDPGKLQPAAAAAAAEEDSDEYQSAGDELQSASGVGASAAKGADLLAPRWAPLRF